MKREFGYNWGRLSSLAFVFAIAVTFIVWRYGPPGPLEVLFLLILFGFFALRPMLTMARVVLTESEIHVSSLLWFGRGRKFQHDEIESYSERIFRIKGRKVPFAGVLRVKGQKNLVLYTSGTKNFKELSLILSELFPKPQDVGEQATESNLKSLVDDAVSKTD